jgi:hypothetical protein
MNECMRGRALYVVGTLKGIERMTSKDMKTSNALVCV